MPFVVMPALVIQTHKRFKRMHIHYDIDTQSANFQGNPLRQATKQHLNGLLFLKRKKMNYFMFGYVVVYLSCAWKNVGMTTVNTCLHCVMETKPFQLSACSPSFSSVWDGNCALRKALARSTPSLKFCQHCLWNSSSVCMICIAFLSFLKKIRKIIRCFLFSMPTSLVSTA